MANYLTSPTALFLIAVVSEIGGTAFLDLGAARNDARFVAAAIGLYGLATLFFFALIRLETADFRVVISLATVIVLVAVIFIDTAFISKSAPTATQNVGLFAACVAVVLLTVPFRT